MVRLYGIQYFPEYLKLGARGKSSTWFPLGGHVKNLIAPRDMMGRSIINFNRQKLSTSPSHGNQVDGLPWAPSLDVVDSEMKRMIFEDFSCKT